MTWSWTDIYLEREEENSVDLIQLFLHSGWNYKDCGEAISYLPLHDQDQFGWRQAPLEKWEEVLLEIKEKWVQNEFIGISLLWKDTQIGGDFLFFPRGFRPKGRLLSISWLINRKPHPQNPYQTDLKWYEPKVILPLLKAKVPIRSVKSEDLSSGDEILASTFYDERSLQQLLEESEKEKVSSENEGEFQGG